MASTTGHERPDMATAPETEPAEPRADRAALARLARTLSFANISAIYVGIAFLVLFTVWVPDLFWSSTTWRTLLSEQAIVAIVACGVVVPFAAGAFDLSIGLAVGAGSMVAAVLMVKSGMTVIPAVILAILTGTAIGVVNAILITRLNIDSFIATLAMSSVLTAFVVAISSGEQVVGLPDSFTNVAGTEIFGIALPVFFMIAIAAALWYLLEHTPPGRWIYATGGNVEAARLAGLRTRTIIAATLIIGSTVAAIGGVLVTSTAAASDPGTGPGYLLPAFAATFLGSTQIRNGQFNIWGTVLAVYILAIGVKGLQLGGAPVWLPDLFNGVALALAVALARYRRKPRMVTRTDGGRATHPPADGDLDIRKE
jgi:ribose transport system permease protein